MDKQNSLSRSKNSVRLLGVSFIGTLEFRCLNSTVPNLSLGYLDDKNNLIPIHFFSFGNFLLSFSSVQNI